MIRKRIKLSPEKAIFIFVDEVLPPTAALMSSIYEEHKDEDGYVQYLLRHIANVNGSQANSSPITVSFTYPTLARIPSVDLRLCRGS